MSCQQLDTSFGLNTLIEGTTPLAHLSQSDTTQPTPGDHDGQYGDPYTYKFNYRWPQQTLEGINTIGSGNNGDGGNVQPY